MKGLLHTGLTQPSPTPRPLRLILDGAFLFLLRTVKLNHGTYFPIIASSIFAVYEGGTSTCIAFSEDVEIQTGVLGMQFEEERVEGGVEFLSDSFLVRSVSVRILYIGVSTTYWAVDVKDACLRND